MIVEVHPHIVGKEKVIHLNDSLAAMDFKMTVQKEGLCVSSLNIGLITPYLIRVSSFSKRSTGRT